MPPEPEPAAQLDLCSRVGHSSLETIEATSPQWGAGVALVGAVAGGPPGPGGDRGGRPAVGWSSARVRVGGIIRARLGTTGYARYKNSSAYCAVVAEVEAVTQVRVRLLTITVDACG